MKSRQMEIMRMNYKFSQDNDETLRFSITINEGMREFFTNGDYVYEL